MARAYNYRVRYFAYQGDYLKYEETLCAACLKRTQSYFASMGQSFHVTSKVHTTDDCQSCGHESDSRSRESRAANEPGCLAVLAFIFVVFVVLPTFVGELWDSEWRWVFLATGVGIFVWWRWQNDGS